MFRLRCIQNGVPWRALVPLAIASGILSPVVALFIVYYFVYHADLLRIAAALGPLLSIGLILLNGGLQELFEYYKTTVKFHKGNVGFRVEKFRGATLRLSLEIYNDSNVIARNCAASVTLENEIDELLEMIKEYARVYVGSYLCEKPDEPFLGYPLVDPRRPAIRDASLPWESPTVRKGLYQLNFCDVANIPPKRPGRIILFDFVVEPGRDTRHVIVRVWSEYCPPPPWSRGVYQFRICLAMNVRTILRFRITVQCENIREPLCIKFPIDYNTLIEIWDAYHKNVERLERILRELKERIRGCRDD